MKSHYLITILIVQFVSTCFSYGQKLTIETRAEIDSLRAIYNNPNTHDTTRINSLYDIGAIYYNIDLKQSLDEFRRVYELSKPLKYKSIDISNWLGSIHYSLGHLDSALYYFQKENELLLKSKEINKVALNQNNIAVILHSQGKVEKSIDMYQSSLKISEKLDDKKNMALAYNNIGYIHKSEGNYDQALNFFKKSLQCRIEIKDSISYPVSLNNIGFIYKKKGLLDSAKYYYNKSLIVSQLVNNKKGIAFSLKNLGNIYETQGQLDRAIKSYEQALTVASKLGNQNEISSCYYQLGAALKKKGEMKNSLYYMDLAFTIYKEGGHAEGVMKTAYQLSELYASKNDFRKAHNLFKLYVTMRDSIHNDETQKKVIEMEVKYEYDKKTLADSLNHAKEQAIIKAEIEKQKAQLEAKRNQQYFLFGGISLVLIFSIFMFNRFRITKKQKNIIEVQKGEVEKQRSAADNQRELVEEKNKQIIDSINYAKRIQSAILPPDKLIKEHLPESFILYKPKDIVAGDFYWLEHKRGQVIYAACDCTGHGVPGAMVSVICNNGLNRSVREYGLTDPAQILDKTREIVISEFEKSEDEVKDGMDAAICSIEGKTLKYAGAHNPLWIIRNGKVLETKANKQPIGKFDKLMPYTTHTFELEKGDTIYTFSDGYVDQFGGAKGKKFKPNAFRKLLISVQGKSMEEQKVIINESFEEWKGENEQVDDVCVIGVRV